MAFDEDEEQSSSHNLMRRVLKFDEPLYPWRNAGFETPNQLLHPENSNGLTIPTSEAGVSGTINDYGESSRLRDQEAVTSLGSETPEAKRPISLIHAVSGDLNQFGNDFAGIGGLLDSKRVAYPRALDLSDEPLDLGEVPSEAPVLTKLKTTHQGHDKKYLQQLADKIYNAHHTNMDGKSMFTSRRKLFAVLSLLEKVASIDDFIRLNIHDNDLPFILKKSNRPGPYNCFVHKDAKDVEKAEPLGCFEGWKDLELEGFNANQWQFLAPYFAFGTKDVPKVQHYSYEDNVILPFIKSEGDDDDDDAREGGFSDVWRVRIHHAHHSRGPAKGLGDNPFYAIKQLKQGTDRKAFENEVSALKRFADKQNFHLIKLLATYHYRKRYHLVFPWADGNMLDFWTEYPNPDTPERDWRFTKWVSQQWLAVAEGLQAIHKAPNDFGLFVISDFGLMQFHRARTMDQVSPTHLDRSPTYRPPECDVADSISQSYDIWTLGCVLLEFAVFYSGGGNEVEQFSKDRTGEERPAPIPEDKFFKVIKNSGEGSSQEIPKVAQLKFSVKNKFKEMRQLCVEDEKYCMKNVSGNVSGNQRTETTPPESHSGSVAEPAPAQERVPDTETGTKDIENEYKA
ncbi:kinase-like domain-containing protein [Bombardia bombarda]|uniref:Kinase-like domain-containing protein n=1 Tax=Bombardia bombarda TaxID=252184 RepID=A0AA39TVR9_9PEZI|nr:kinase-like domain-containing protein [Bombardia bombarda]